MNRAIHSTTNVIKDWARQSSDFFHVPIDPRTIAAIRISYAILMLINVLCWAPDLDRWFSNAGIVSLPASRRLIDPWCLTLFQVLPDELLHVFYGIFVAQLVALLVGWRPRLQATCCYVWLVSFQHRNSLIFDGEDTMFRIIGFLLIFMPLNATWAISRKAGQLAPPTVDGWAVRLLQLEMTMVYFSAAWNKLLGAPWRDGTALYYVMQLDEYWGRFPLPESLLQIPWVVRGLTWSTMAVEFSVPVLIWFAPTRRLALAVVVAFHLGCDYAMHLFLFHWIMLVGWLAFVDANDWQWMISRLRSRKPAADTSSPDDRPESRI